MAEAKASTAAAPAKEDGKERVPDSYIQYLLEHPPRRPPVVTESFFETFPRLRELTIVNTAKLNKLADLKEYVLRQYHKKGYAEVGVHYTDDGLKILSPLPEEEE